MFQTGRIVEKYLYNVTILATPYINKRKVPRMLSFFALHLEKRIRYNKSIIIGGANVRCYVRPARTILHNRRNMKWIRSGVI